MLNPDFKIILKPIVNWTSNPISMLDVTVFRHFPVSGTLLFPVFRRIFFPLFGAFLAFRHKYNAPSH